MTILLAFAITLLIAVLISDLAERSVLSTALVFLIAGFLLGGETLNVIQLSASDPLVSAFTQVALFAVLFTEGMRLGIRDLGAAWRLPGRALLLGMPLTLLLTALLAHVIVGFAWTEALLIGAILSPTDPVFAATLVGREEVPRRVRDLLNIESGVNDGLALPFVLVLLALVSGRASHPLDLGAELLLGVVLGTALPLLVLWIERRRAFSAASSYRPLTALAIGLAVFSISSLTHANSFLAAFAAGVTIASVNPGLRDAFAPLGDHLTELLKLGGVMIVGVLLAPTFLLEVGWRGYAFALVALVAVRPGALAIALAGSGLSRREWLVAAWFGPRGFASIFYGLLVLDAGISSGSRIFHLVAVVVGMSIVAHSSTDVPLARWVTRVAPRDMNENVRV